MAVKSHSGDRRAALKARSRQAILDAAAELIRQRRSVDFSVDELAAAADISRRTVFNHFDSLDDVAIEVAGQMLSEVVDQMEAQTTSASREVGTVLEDLAATASGARLVPTVAYLVEIFAGEDPRQSTHNAVLMQGSLALFTQRMSGVIARQHPEVEALKVDLLVAAFGGGLLGLAFRWIEETGAVDTPDSHRVWDELISTLVSVLREPAP